MYPLHNSGLLRRIDKEIVDYAPLKESKDRNELHSELRGEFSVLTEIQLRYFDSAFHLDGNFF
jgi:hypothetical protein